jgi:hypothetical protein
MADGDDPGELEDLLRSLGPSRPSPGSVASAKVAAIVEAAERAAEDLRLKTEERARERIAEGDRAAGLRVDAAEAEARDIVETARREAAALVEQARRDVQGVHDEAARTRSDAEAEAARLRAEVDTYANETKQAARNDAREIIAEAQAAARAVLADGTELSGHLDELGSSLRRNAERLLNDVKLAHARLTAELDQATPAADEGEPRAPAPGFASRPASERRPPRRGAGRSRGDDDFEIPEFLPGRR